MLTCAPLLAADLRSFKPPDLSSSHRFSSATNLARRGPENFLLFPFGKRDLEQSVILRPCSTLEHSVDSRQQLLVQASDLSNPPVSRAPTNFAGLASRVGAVGPKKSAPLGAMAPSKFFGLLSKGARPESTDSMLPAEVPSFLREFRPAKKSAFVR
jgi:hypothetical protein